MTEAKTEEKIAPKPGEQPAVATEESSHADRPPREPVKLLPVEPEKRTFWQRLNHSLLYGARQTFFCLATDPLEPFINKWFQNKVGDKEHEVTNKHTFVGEISGDVAAFGVYVGIKTFLSAPVNATISAVKSIGNPVLTKMGKKNIARWAEEHHVSEDDPRYKKRVDEYKTYQAENAVDSAIITVSSTGLNLLAQRHLLHNEQSYMTMFKGKLMGAGLTLIAMFSSSVLFPKQTRRIEDKIEEKLVNPGMKIFKGLIGVNDDPEEVITKTPAGQHPTDGSIPLSPEKREGLLAMVVEHALKIDFKDPAQRNALLAKQKSVYQAFLKVLDAEGPLVSLMAREHLEVVEKDPDHGPGADGETRMRDHEASHMAAQASAAHKRRDMQHFIALLDDPAFLKDVEAAVAAGKIPERRNSSITPEQRDYMSQSLLKRSPNSDPSMAILDTADQQALDYRALAHSLEPEGIAGRTLARELKKHLPDYDPKDVDGIAKDYMQYYQKEALTMAAEFQPESETVKSAIKRAENLRAKYHTAPSETSYAMAT